MRYDRQRVISGKGVGRGEFSDALRGLTIGPKKRLYVVGDSKLVVFSLEGELLKTWVTERPGFSVSINSDEKIFVGQAGQVQIFDIEGKLLDTWGDESRLGLVSAIGFAGETVVLADVQDRCLRRYDAKGKYLGNIGKDNRMKGFLIPNRHLDFAVDAAGVIHVCNPGKHRVERYTVDDKLLGHIGHFGGGSDPTGFTGCCNPTNLALAGVGRVVVTTKAGPQVKVYDADGKMLALIDDDQFDPNCKNMDVAVDVEGRLYVIDTTRLHICVFAPKEREQTGDGKAVKP